MKWFNWKRKPVPKKRKPVPTVLRVTQNKIGDDGKPGTLEVAGVSHTGIVGDRLCGYAADGRIIAMFPLGEVALAIVGEA